MAESDKVINAVMKATGDSYDRVSRLCTVAHETVDECLTDDISVVAPPLVIGRLGCPVLDRLLLRLGDGQWQLPESVDVTEPELAETLMLPIETIARYPMIGRFGLLARCMDRLLIDDADAERSLAILDAWLARYEPAADGQPTPYQVWGLPDRATFEGWLLARLDLLHAMGYAVRLANEEMDGVRGQQHMFVDGRRADLLMRFAADCEKGAADDWLVVESKTTAVGIGALDQLAMSVDWLRAESRPGAVHGLLIADGLSLEVERGLRERRFDYQSMTALGYRRWVRFHSPVQPEPARDATSINYPQNLSVRTLAPALR
ncbi:MAG: hypothetical protein WB797_05020 [Nocardioides sp.]